MYFWESVVYDQEQALPHSLGLCHSIFVTFSSLKKKSMFKDLFKTSIFSLYVNESN